MERLVKPDVRLWLCVLYRSTCVEGTEPWFCRRSIPSARSPTPTCHKHCLTWSLRHPQYWSLCLW